MSSDLLQAEVNYRRQLAELYCQEESRSRQQSRICWLREGDANTAFFHASVRARHSRNTIRNLDHQGNLLNDNLSITQAFRDHYLALFNQRRNIRGLPSNLILNKISKSDNQTLCSLASFDELREVISRLSIDRASGVDGYNGGFYRATWSIIFADLL